MNLKRCQKVIKWVEGVLKMSQKALKTYKNTSYDKQKLFLIRLKFAELSKISQNIQKLSTKVSKKSTKMSENS